MHTVPCVLQNYSTVLPIRMSSQGESLVFCKALPAVTPPPLPCVDHRCPPCDLQVLLFVGKSKYTYSGYRIHPLYLFMCRYVTQWIAHIRPVLNPITSRRFAVGVVRDWPGENPACFVLAL